MPLASLFPAAPGSSLPLFPPPCPLLPPSFLSALSVSPFLPLRLDQPPLLSPVADLSCLSSLLIPLLPSLPPLSFFLLFFSYRLLSLSLIPSSTSISLFIFPSGSHSLSPILPMYFPSLLHPFRVRARVRSVMHTFKETPINSVIKIILF